MLSEAPSGANFYDSAMWVGSGSRGVKPKFTPDLADPKEIPLARLEETQGLEAEVKQAWNRSQMLARTLGPLSSWLRPSHEVTTKQVICGKVCSRKVSSYHLRMMGPKGHLGHGCQG
jgi:hypothetical protein